MTTQLQSGPISSDERQLCCEPGCDREPAPHDARCILHTTRLGPMPREVVDTSRPLETQLRPPSAVPAPAAAQPSSANWPVKATSALASSLLSYGTAASFVMNWVPRDLGMFVGGLFLASSIASAILGWKQLRDADDGTQTILGVLLLFFACVPATGVALAAAFLLFSLIA